jgi:hypothetical protein
MGGAAQYKEECKGVSAAVDTTAYSSAVPAIEL